MSSLLSISNHKIIQVLGRGVNTVYLCENNTTGIKVACKVINKKSSDALAMKHLEQEVSALKRLKHKNIIQLLDVIDETDQTTVVTEYMPGWIDLFDFLDPDDKPFLPPKESLAILGRVILALKYCHDQDVAHRDVKVENILVDPKTYKSKLMDFEFAREFSKDSPAKTACGSFPYASPEILQCEGKKPYDAKKSDVWSAGVVLFHMLTGNLPFHSESNVVLRQLIIAGFFDIPDFVDKDMKDLIICMLNINPEKRPSSTDILNLIRSDKYTKFFVDSQTNSSQKPEEGDQKA